MLGAAGRTPRASPPPLQPGALRGLCAWLDGLPLSRPKRHLARDFSDGVMLAEIVKHSYPRRVDLHNYVPTCNTDQKLSDWNTLNRKVFHKLRLWVSETDIRKVVASTPGAIEPTLSAGPHGTLQCEDPSESEDSREDRLLHVHRGPASGPWGHLDSRLQELLEEKEQALAVLQEMVKILQMKVVRLEHLVKLKDQRIGELTRPGDEPSDGKWQRRKAPPRGLRGHPSQVH